MQVAIHFDVICPWCFIGLKRLRVALARRDGLDVGLVWRPYFLNPDLPDSGIEFPVYIERKFGGALRGKRLLASLEEIGRPLGIPFAFADIRRVPPTLDAHRLIRLAHRHGVQSEVAEALFAAHFCHGEDIGDADTLTAAGTRAGLDAAEIRAALEDAALAATLRDEATAAQRSGTLGVPLFVLNDSFVITGAHEPEVLVRMLDVAAAGEELARASSGNFTPQPRSRPALP